MIKSPSIKLLTFLLAFSLLNSSLVYGIISPPLSKSGTSTLGVNHTGHNREQTTLATLGGGNIQIGGKQQSNADLAKQGINTDATKTQKLTKNQQTGGLDATVTVDHRLASEKGRQQIANDVQDTYEHGEDIYRAAASEGTGIADKVSAVHQNAQLTQLKNDLVRNPDNAQLLADLNSQDPDTKAQAMVQVAKMAQAKFGIAPKDLNLYDSKKTTSGSLKDNALSDVKGATVTDKNNSQYGQAFVDVGDNASEQDIANTMGHEASEQINLANGGSQGIFGKRDEQSAEAMNNAFGNQFADRLNQATGNTLSGTGSNFKGTKTAQNGTQAANQVGNASVNYRQYVAIRGGNVSQATEYGVEDGMLVHNGDNLKEFREKINKRANAVVNLEMNRILKDPDNAMDNIKKVLDEKTIINVLNDPKLNAKQKESLILNKYYKKVKKGVFNHMYSEEMDSSLVTLGVSIKKIDPDTKVKIFDSGQKDKIITSITKDYEKGEQILLQGHSAGGGDVQDISQSLKNQEIEKNVITVQIDSIEPLGDDSTIPSNVRKAINVYQAESKTGVAWIDNIYPNAINGEDSVEADSPNDTIVVNKRFKNIQGPSPKKDSASPHRNIDNDRRVQKFIHDNVLPEVEKDINDQSN